MSDATPADKPLAHVVILHLLEATVNNLIDQIRQRSFDREPRFSIKWWELQVQETCNNFGITACLRLLREMQMSTEHLRAVVEKLNDFAVMTSDEELQEIHTPLVRAGDALKDELLARLRAETASASASA